MLYSALANEREQSINSHVPIINKRQDINLLHKLFNRDNIIRIDNFLDQKTLKALKMDEDLGKAVKKALNVDSASCRNYALEHTWELCTKRFLSHFQYINREKASMQLGNS